MKMNKILAAGVAASLAVTSLAAVASAAERTFEMKVTEGSITYSAKADKEINVSLDNQFGYDDGTASATGHYVPTTIAAGNKDVTLDDPTLIDYRDFDAFIPVTISGNTALVEKLGDVKVVINGRKMDNGNLVAISQTATLEKTNVYASDGTTLLGNYILPIFYEIAPQGAFLANDFVAVDSIQVVNPSAGDIKIPGFGKDAYNTITGETGKYTLVDADTAKTKVAATTNKSAASAKATIAVKASTNAWQITTNTTVAKETNGVRKITLHTSDAAPAGDVKLFNKIIELIGTNGINFTWWNASGEKKDYEAWLPVTDNHDTKNNPGADGTISRDEVWLLSDTADHGSFGQDWIKDGGTQTYEEKDYNKGTQPKGFAGLASQFADFFNKQLNGTITFHFTAGKAASEDTWLNGGIPSTEVGIKNSMKNMTNNDIALFVNYGSTTGSLQAATEVKAEELSVTFDISEILDALGGQTIGTVQDVYYGMVKGVEYEGIATKGFKVDQVVFAYDEDADDGDIVDGDEDEGDVDVDTDEDEGDEGDVEVDGDEDEGDGEVDGDTDEDLPTDEDEAGEDENPGTGVALAVVPAIMAAAAVVVSKKRK